MLYKLQYEELLRIPEVSNFELHVHFLTFEMNYQVLHVFGHALCILCVSITTVVLLFVSDQPTDDTY